MIYVYNVTMSENSTLEWEVRILGIMEMEKVEKLMHLTQNLDAREHSQTVFQKEEKRSTENCKAKSR